MTNEKPLTLEDVTAQFKKMEAEFGRLKLDMKAAGDAFEEFSNVVSRLEHQFAFFRALYWKMKDALNRFQETPPSIPSEDDTAIQPPAATPGRGEDTSVDRKGS